MSYFTTRSDVAAEIRFDADDSAPTYIGVHSAKNALTSDNSWTVYKFTYSAGNVTRIQKSTGSWDNRATLFS